MDAEQRLVQGEPLGLRDLVKGSRGVDPGSPTLGPEPCAQVWPTHVWTPVVDHRPGASGGGCSPPPQTQTVGSLLCVETGITANLPSLRMKRERV